MSVAPTYRLAGEPAITGPIGQPNVPWYTMTMEAPTNVKGITFHSTIHMDKLSWERASVVALRRNHFISRLKDSVLQYVKDTADQGVLIRAAAKWADGVDWTATPPTDVTLNDRGDAFKKA